MFLLHGQGVNAGSLSYIKAQRSALKGNMARCGWKWLALKKMLALLQALTIDMTNSLYHSPTVLYRKKSCTRKLELQYIDLSLICKEYPYVHKIRSNSRQGKKLIIEILILMLFRNIVFMPMTESQLNLP